MQQRPNNIQGGLLESGASGIVGWARNPDSPAEIVRVVLSVGGKPVATVLADQFDLDLVRRQVGPGVGGFAVQLPSVPAGKPPYIITARSSDGQRLGEGLSISSAEQMAACIAGGVKQTAEGMVDLLASGRLQGWLWYPDTPDRIAEVEVLDNSNLLGRARADNFRADLERAGKRGGYCGFLFELPASLLDMKPHSIRVVAAGTLAELANSPLQFGPLVVSGLTEDVTRLRSEVDRLHARLDELTDAGGSLQKEVLRVLADRISAFSAIQAEALERRVEAMEQAVASRRLRLLPKR